MVAADLIICKVLVLLAACTTLAYLLRVYLNGRSVSERVERQGGSLLLSKWVMEMGYWAMRPFARFAVRHGISANLISYSALPLGAAAGFCVAYGHLGWAALFGLLGSVFDAMDGAVARATGTMSYSGKILDSALDRYVEFFLLIGLLALFHPLLWTQLLVASALLASFMVSYTTALGEIAGVQLPRGSMQRPERLVYLLSGILITPLLEDALRSPYEPIQLALGLIALIGNLSAILRIRFIRKAVEAREQKVISMTLAQVRSVRSNSKPSRRLG
jgi:phosphatidylglycerophosphate synthase